jgi:hypothetical protein
MTPAILSIYRIYFPFPGKCLASTSGRAQDRLSSLSFRISIRQMSDLPRITVSHSLATDVTCEIRGDKAAGGTVSCSNTDRSKEIVSSSKRPDWF